MNWQETKLQDTCEFKTGKLNSNAAVENGIYPFFTCSPDALKIDTYTFDTEAVLLAGNNAEGKFNVKLYKGKFDAYQRTYVISTNKKNLLNIKYLFYSLGLQLNYLKTVSIGTATKFLTMSILNNIKIPLPPLPEQRAIAEILSSIDDKIELNNQMNRTLEATAHALFKQWFVDFEFPVTQSSTPLSQRSDQKNQPEVYSLNVAESGNTYKANKFNNIKNPLQSGEGGPLAVDEVGYKSSGGKMIDSELGPIPEKWEIAKIDDLGKVICGKTPSTQDKENFIDGAIPFIKIPDMHDQIFSIKTENYISEKGAACLNNKKLPAYSLCISCIATVGLVVITDRESFTNQQINSIVVKNQFTLYYLYFIMKSLSDKLTALASSGSATLNLNTGQFSKINIIKPSDEILDLFNDLVSSIFERIKANEHESQTLSTLRDSLLPKLMSGELRVPEEIVRSFEDMGCDV